MGSPCTIIAKFDTRLSGALQIQIRRGWWRPLLPKEPHRSSASFLYAVLNTVFEEQPKIEAEFLWSSPGVGSGQHRRVTIMSGVGDVLGWISLLELLILRLEPIDRTSLAVNPMAIKLVCLTYTFGRVGNVKQTAKSHSLTSPLQKFGILLVKERILCADVVCVYVVKDARRVLNVLGIHDPQL